MSGKLISQKAALMMAALALSEGMFTQGLRAPSTYEGDFQYPIRGSKPKTTKAKRKARKKAQQKARRA
jgi:hypothetical protein